MIQVAIAILFRRPTDAEILETLSDPTNAVCIRNKAAVYAKGCKRLAGVRSRSAKVEEASRADKEDAKEAAKEAAMAAKAARAP